MRVVTWNMGNRTGAWSYLLDEISPDVALLQEAQVRAASSGHVSWEAIGQHSAKYGAAGTYRWGSAVWSHDHELEPVSSTHRGWVQVARSLGPEALTFISVHVELDREGRSIPTLHRILSDLTPLIEREPLLILGGDLNADVVFDERHGTKRHAIAFQRIEDLGLWHCNQLLPQEQRGTYRPDTPVMDDHLFVSDRLRDRVLECQVVRDERNPSDHFPVVVELDARS